MKSCDGPAGRFRRRRKVSSQGATRRWHGNRDRRSLFFQEFDTATMRARTGYNRPTNLHFEQRTPGEGGIFFSFFFLFFFFFFFFSSPTVRSAAERRLELDWTCNFGEYTRFDAQRSLDVCEHIRGRLCTRLTRAAAAAAGARVGDWRRGGCGVASSKRAVSRLRARSCGRRSSKTGRLRGRERGSRGGGGSGVYRLISLGVVADGARVAGACIDARLGQCA